MVRVLIGLALYQGAEHIMAQLDSIAAQDYRDWRLIVSDDGSDDDGVKLVRQFAATQPPGRVRIVGGPRKGATRNFLSLIGHAKPGEYLALSDQDDVWRPDKLSRALTALSKHQTAGLYSARTTICDEKLIPQAGARRFRGPFEFRNALVQAVTAGNTCVLAPKAVDVARKAAGPAAAAGIESHDWWLYQLISGAGMQVLRDDAEVLYYRQHEGNLKGRNDTFMAMRIRLGQLFDGNYRSWLYANLVALSGVRDLLSPENRTLLDTFNATLSQPGWCQVRVFRRMGIRRQTMAGTFAFYTAALMGRLRRS
ncbi:MAG: glycosyltransferase [Paracoccus sp. (in: a-proteobacteria)]